MAGRPKSIIPIPRHHKASDRSYVWYEGRRVYLGKHGSQESVIAYQQFLENVSDKSELVDWEKTEHTVRDILVAFLPYAEKRYSRRQTIFYWKQALGYLRPYADLPADRFGPKKLKEIREALVSLGNARKTINQKLGYIKLVFKWAVSEEMCQEGTYRALTTLAPVDEKDEGVPAPRDVKPALWEHVEATIPYVPSVVHQAVIQLLWNTGLRAMNALTMKWSEIDKAGEVWRYTPTSHKLSWKGKTLTVSLGEASQELLLEYQAARPLKDCDFLFTPWESDASKLSKQSTLNPKTWSEAMDSVAQRSRSTEYRSCKCITAAITRAAKKAGVPHWWAHMMRHAYADRVQAALGIEAAKAAVGHSSLDMTRHYAGQDEALADKVARELG